MVKSLDKVALLGRLERIKYEKGADEEAVQLEQMSLAGALLVLAGIDHEREYTLCHALAEHLLGRVPEPDDADLEME
ncbi:MAG: hypothetical protein M3416_13415 [Acidobacteriota bacterium]|nr:hypothetical protein [Acidobacteriota bacterium]